MKNKNDYIDELLSDEYLIGYILTNKGSGIKFWSDLRESDPVKYEAYQEVERFILSLSDLKEINHDCHCLKEKIWEAIEEDIRNRDLDRSNRNLIGKIIKIAAVFILPLLVFAFFRFYHGNEKELTGSMENEQPDTEVKIILSNGEYLLPSTMDLNESFENAGASVQKTGRTSLSYKSRNLPEPLRGKNTVYNTVVVPRGKRYNIELPDGSLAWINSDTELKFPVQFAEGENRKVYLKGEAFFEVVHDSSSGFIVSTADIDVIVHGTSFNVSAYDDMNKIETTLVEGEVGIDVHSDTKGLYRLKPNEMANYSKDNGSVDVTEVDVMDYTSWKDGYLIFSNEEMKTLGPKIERWYDVKLIYREDDIRDMRFSGIIREEKSIEHIMGLLENACDLTYRINDNNVILFKEQKLMNFK